MLCRVLGNGRETGSIVFLVMVMIMDVVAYLIIVCIAS